MSDKHLDINDDEIRIISPVLHNGVTGRGRSRKLSATSIVLLIVAACLIVAGILYLVTRAADSSQVETDTVIEIEDGEEVANLLKTPSIPTLRTEKAYVDIQDTIVNKVPLRLYIPRYAVPSLSIGVETLQDTVAVLVVQAADIRRDNGKIVGTYVIDGQLVAQGQSKSGYCAIINGNVVIGVADSTPYLEQAIDTDGYFFRQYPLVVGGQVVDNVLERTSQRKALVELNGTEVVVMTMNPMTMNDFSQSLVDLGVTNAIYLVGSSAYGFARDKEGNRVTFGTQGRRAPRYTNYMVWK